MQGENKDEKGMNLERSEMESASGTAPAIKPLPRKALVILAFVVLAVVLVVSLSKRSPGELPVYLRAASNLQHHETLYRRADPKPFTYPPFFAVPMMPWLLIPESGHRVTWALANAVVLAVGLWVIVRRVWPFLGATGKTWPQWVFWTWLTLMSLTHVLSPIENQSHDLWVFLLVVLAVDASCQGGREPLVGLWAGLAAACKATPALFLPVLLWQRRWVAGVLLVLTMVSATLLTDVLWPAREGKLRVVQWYETFVAGQSVGAAADGMGAWARWNRLNQSLSGTIYRLFTRVTENEFQTDVSLINLDHQTVRGITLLAQLVVVGWILVASRPGLSRGLAGGELALRRFGEGGLVVCGTVLLSPMSSKAHFAVLLIPMAFCLIHFLYRRGGLVVGVSLVLVTVCSLLTAKDLWGRSLGNQILARGPVTLGALLCLGATGYVLRTSGRRFRTGETAGIGQASPA